MKKALSILCFALSVLLIAAFIALLRRDYLVSYPFGSAPFYIYVLERGIEFIIPAAICVFAGVRLMRR